MIDQVSTISLFYSDIVTLWVYWIRGKNIEFLAVVIRDSFQGSRTFLFFFQLLCKVGHRLHSGQHVIAGQAAGLVVFFTGKQP